MKVILCTGDSHTQGQGQTTFYDPMPERPVKTYDLVTGTGMAFRRIFRSDCYVNQIRDAVCAKTGSTEEDIPVAFLAEIQGEAVYDCDGSDMFVFSFAEKQQEAVVCIYLDGELYRRVRLHTDKPKWDDWSVRDIRVMCSGKKEIKLLPESGSIRLIAAHKYAGEYAVINCGVGSCNCKSYLDICMDELIREFDPYMFIAQAHTINDWLTGKTVAEYKAHFGMLLDKMMANAKHTIVVTVPPILGDQIRTQGAKPTADYFENFVEASRQCTVEKNLPLVDINAEVKQHLKGLSEEEKKDALYVDTLHVNSKGHKIYADKIMEMAEKLL